MPYCMLLGDVSRAEAYRTTCMLHAADVEAILRRLRRLAPGDHPMLDMAQRMCTMAREPVRHSDSVDGWRSMATSMDRLLSILESLRIVSHVHRDDASVVLATRTGYCPLTFVCGRGDPVACLSAKRLGPFLKRADDIVDAGVALDLVLKGLFALVRHGLRDMGARMNEIY